MCQSAVLRIVPDIISVLASQCNPLAFIRMVFPHCLGKTEAQDAGLLADDVNTAARYDKDPAAHNSVGA